MSVDRGVHVRVGYSRSVSQSAEAQWHFDPQLGFPTLVCGSTSSVAHTLSKESQSDDTDFGRKRLVLRRRHLRLCCMAAACSNELVICLLTAGNPHTFGAARGMRDMPMIIGGTDCGFITAQTETSQSITLRNFMDQSIPIPGTGLRVGLRAGVSVRRTLTHRTLGQIVLQSPSRISVVLWHEHRVRLGRDPRPLSDRTKVHSPRPLALCHSCAPQLQGFAH